MKIIAIIMSLTLVSCTEFPSEQRSWSFIKSVGGISIDKPFLKNNSYHLPIKVDVSGLQKITTKPTKLNSALMCSRIGYLIEENEISISVYTSLINDTASSNCKSILLTGITPGVYKVFYNQKNHSKHLIGSITIRTKKEN